MLDALKNLLEPEFEVVGMFPDGRALMEGALSLSPNVIVLDIGMPMMNGLNAGQRLKQAMPLVKLVYVTMNHDPDIQPPPSYRTQSVKWFAAVIT
jgi:DNA-binding NarL/FixJ family response regulator